MTMTEIVENSDLVLVRRAGVEPGVLTRSADNSLEKLDASEKGLRLRSLMDKTGASVIAVRKFGIEYQFPPVNKTNWLAFVRIIKWNGSETGMQECPENGLFENAEDCIRRLRDEWLLVLERRQL